MLATLKPDHPRLLLAPGDPARIQDLAARDPLARDLLALLRRHADQALTTPVVAHRREGRRLLSECRASLGRILSLSLAWRLTGEPRYLARAEQELLAAAALPDWNPSHFLDTAEMATGLALGYDWLYHDLPAATRGTLRTALVAKALQPGFADEPWWAKGHNNWNQVCNAGMVLAGLAIAEDEPAWAERALRRARAGLPAVMATSYVPDGAYPEGPNYWEYGTTYNVILIAALDSALGQDFGLSAQPGFANTAAYRLAVMAPDHLVYSYSDSNLLPAAAPLLYWFARKFDRPELATQAAPEVARAVARQLAGPPSATPHRFMPLELLWYTPGTPSAPLPPCEYLGRGANPIAISRSSWADPDALWLAVKGGDNRNSHNHMDAGSFMVVAGGERWSWDLGMENYTVMEAAKIDLWGKQRYQCLRMGVIGHSTLVLGGADQELEDSASPILGSVADAAGSRTLVDLSKPWRRQAERVWRGAARCGNDFVLIQDEVTGARGELLWQMIVPDDMQLAGGEATLQRHGQRFRLRLLAPAGAVFERLPLTPAFAVEKPNEGLAKLVFRVPPAPGPLTLAVQMWLDRGTAPAVPKLEPLAGWAGAAR